jgi:uncharacterized protein (TIGR03435 family)
MVQSLLADRFRMRVKTETQELPVYALLVMKNGPKLTPSVALPDGQKLQLPQLHFTAAGSLNATNVSMMIFAGWLSGRPDTGDRIVIDETSLDGRYDFALEWSPVLNSGTSGGADSNQQQDNPQPKSGDKPPLFTAIEEQLGLKIESRKAPVEVLVIDGLEQPSAN